MVVAAASASRGVRQLLRGGGRLFARGYNSRGQLDRHLAGLEALASTVEPAHQPHGFRRKAKIVCTIGPKVANVDDIRMLMTAGMNVARFNFSHGEYSWFEEVIAMIRMIKEESGRSDVAIALDTKGPEIRTGQHDQGTPAGDPGLLLPIVRGDSVLFSSDSALEKSGNPQQIYLDYSDIGRSLQPGSSMMIDDGLLEFSVTETGDGWVKATAMNSGGLGERKGVNLPGAELTLPAVSDKDKADLAFGAAQKVDLIFASFVRKGSHVEDIRTALGTHSAKVISKIENLEGVQNFDEILTASDGIMVARGDLGIEIPAPKVFVSQKLIIAKCNLAGKPVICATQMLESMVFNPRPTRAEVSDVANAVVDGADAVMLSGETAKGAWPREAVRTMASVVREAEATMNSEFIADRQQIIKPRTNYSSLEAVCAGAAQACRDQNASMLMVVTETGEGARLAAKYRPSVPIIACCSNAATARSCALLRGVIPIIVPWQMASQSSESHAEISADKTFWTVSVKKVIAVALQQVRAKGIISDDPEGKALVLHDSDITDGEEMQDWVLRLVGTHSSMVGGTTATTSVQDSPR